MWHDTRQHIRDEEPSQPLFQPRPGGEEVEIVDKKIPVARPVHVSQGTIGRRHAVWIQEMIQLGIVTCPRRTKLPPEILSRPEVPSGGTRAEVLKALLEERDTRR